MLENIHNNIKSYDDMIYNSQPVKVSDYIANKYNDVHRILYKYALNKYLHDFIDKKIIKDCKIIYHIYDYIINENNPDSINILLEIFDSIKINHEDLTDIIINYIKNELLSLRQSIKTQCAYIGEINEQLLFIITDDIQKEYSNIINDDSELLKQLCFDKDGNLYLLLNQQIDNNDKLSINILLEKYNRKIKTIITNIFIFYFKKSHKFIEIKNNEYWKPSSVYVIGAKYPYNKIVVNLEKYWNMYQNKNIFDINKLKIIKDENILDSQIEELNYLTGKAKMYSKSADLTYEVDFDYINENTNVDNDILLENTFTYKYRNINK